MDRKQRRSIRLPDYDYSQLGAYFVTICVQGKEPLLGSVAGGEMRLNALGQLAADGWGWLSIQFPLVSVPVWCVMPNHAHAVIVISESDLGRGGLQTAPTNEPTKKKPWDESQAPRLRGARPPAALAAVTWGCKWCFYN